MAAITKIVLKVLKVASLTMTAQKEFYSQTRTKELEYKLGIHL